MKLHLAKWHLLHTDYTLEPHGEVVYKVQTNSKWWPTETKISKKLPEGIPSHQFWRPDWGSGSSSGHGRSMELYDDLPTPSARGEKESEEDMEKDNLGNENVKRIDATGDRFAHLARIYYRAINPSIISMGGQEFEVSSYFRKGSLGWYGRDRIFVAPDGKEYKWVLGFTTSQLLLNDGSKTVVANYYRKFWNIPHKPENAYLEIMPNGEHIVNLILVTFLYIEKIRDEREKSVQRA